MRKSRFLGNGGWICRSIVPEKVSPMVWSKEGFIEHGLCQFCAEMETKFHTKNTKDTKFGKSPSKLLRLRLKRMPNYADTVYRTRFCLAILEKWIRTEMCP